MFRSKINPAACSLGPDGMALLGRTLHDLRGIRYTDAGNTGPGNAPASPPPPAPAPSTTPPAPGTPPTPTPPAPGAPSTAPATPPAATDPATPPATPPAPVDPNSTSVDPKTGKPQAPVGGVAFADLPPATQDEVRKLRESDRQRREMIRDAAPPEARAAIAAALGLEANQADDPQALAAAAAQLTTRAETAEAERDNALRGTVVLTEAPDAGGNAKLLLDSMGFRESIKGLSPTDTTAIQNAIKTWVAAHPEHAATARPGLPLSSGPRPQGASVPQARPGLEGAVAKALQQQS